MRQLALASCFVLFACGGEAVDDGGGGAGTADVGNVTPDAGQVIADTGAEPSDSGMTPTEDAGSEPADAGEATPDDAGAPPPPPRDSGPTPGRPDAGQGGGGGGGSCIDAMQCALNCANDAECIAGCLAAVAPEHRQVTQAMLECGQRNNCADPNCLMQRCQEEAQACGRAGGGGGGGNPPGGADGGRPPNPGDMDGGGGPPNPGGNGTDSCADFLQCAMACPPNDQQCGGGCTRNVRAQSTELMNAVMMCMMRAGCRDFNCGRTSCPNQFQACMADR